MISGKLVHLIETHQQEIVSRCGEQILRDPAMARTRAVLGSGLRHWHCELLDSLSRWLSTRDDEHASRGYETAGRNRREQGIALDECIRDICTLRETLLDYVEEQTCNKDSVELYAEEEFDRRVGRFFDLIMVKMVRGYESTHRHAAVG